MSRFKFLQFSWSGKRKIRKNFLCSAVLTAPRFEGYSKKNKHLKKEMPVPLESGSGKFARIFFVAQFLTAPRFEPRNLDCCQAGNGKSLGFPLPRSF